MKLGGPSIPALLADWPLLHRRPLDVFARWRARYGAWFRLPLLSPPVYFVLDPVDVREMLVARSSLFPKRLVSESGQEFLGQGLTTSIGPLHLHQRKLVQPLFAPPRLESIPAVTWEAARRETAGWVDGATVDAAAAMRRVTLSVVGRALLGVDLEGLDELIDAYDAGQRYCQAGRFTPWPAWARRFRRGDLRRAQRVIDRVTGALINGRRRSGRGAGDLLDVLLSARGLNGEPLGDSLIQNEIATFLAAGYDTSANAVSWTLHLLARHSDARARAREEVDRVLGGRPPDHVDLPRLEYVARAFKEALRLYPPIWSLRRVAMEEVVLPSGLRVPAGAHVVMMIYLMHRDPERFPEPERFDPDRFLREPRPASYLPFGLGPRSCLGEPFALSEGVTLLAHILQSHDFAAAPGRPVTMDPLVSLRPSPGVPLVVSRRRTAETTPVSGNF